MKYLSELYDLADCLKSDVEETMMRLDDGNRVSAKEDLEECQVLLDQFADNVKCYVSKKLKISGS